MAASYFCILLTHADALRREVRENRKSSRFSSSPLAILNPFEPGDRHLIILTEAPLGLRIPAL